ncbi:MAG: efflux RND transporter periplasmic adaptor subunit [Myxococcota bacterium]
MKAEHRAWLKRYGPWIAVPVVAVVAFVLGTTLGAGDGASERRHEGHAHAEGASDEETVWTCSMHPQIRRSEPGQCPICGMDLIPASGSEEGGGADDDPTRITLSERSKVLARIRTAPVERLDDTAAERRLLGRVEYDETTLQTVTAWAGGRIDRLHVDVTGVRVRRGQPIATIYSPEIYQAHQDLISARKQAGGAAGDVQRSTAQSALAATRQRLRLLGVPDAQITKMGEAEQPSRNIAIRTPFGGTIVERLATEGQYVETGDGLYRLADLRRLWVQLDAYESDLSRLSKGQEVKLEVNALPGQELIGKVAFIDPVIDPQKRTAKVRIEVENPDGKLRPGMFAEAVVNTGTPEAGESPLVIPASAPLFTGRRSLVYVQVPEATQPTYEARVVKLGPRMDTVYPVIAGLRAGERVVEHGAFALDADLQIRGGISMMSIADDTEHGPYDDIVEVPAAFREALGKRLAPYLRLQEALAADDREAAGKAAAALVEGARAFDGSASPEGRRAWEPIQEPLATHAQQVARASSLDEARETFQQVAEQMARVLRVFGNPFDRPLRLVHCPMAFDEEGAEWLQTGETIDNTYFGSEMRTCGEIRATIGPGDYLSDHRPADEQAPAPAAGHQH